MYISRVKKLLQLVNFSRPECLNRVRYLSMWIGERTYGHMVFMMWKTKHCFRDAKHGLNLRPRTTWNDDCNFEFLMSVNTDNGYYNCPDTMNIISTYSALLCDAVGIMQISL